MTFAFGVSPAIAKDSDSDEKSSNSESGDDAALVDRVLQNEDIAEASGLSVSAVDPNVVFTHNDSDGDAVVFAIDEQGDTEATLALDGADIIDWEDMAAGPDNTQNVGDIGDNDLERDFVSVYQFTEPEDIESQVVDATQFDFVYPDGPHNAESLLVNPVSGQIFIATKEEDGEGQLFAAPENLSTSSDNELEEVADNIPELATGGAFFPDGEQFVIRTQESAFIFPEIGADPEEIALPQDEEAKGKDAGSGESVTVANNGNDLLVGGEGENSTIFDVDASGADNAEVANAEKSKKNNSDDDADDEKDSKKKKSKDDDDDDKDSKKSKKDDDDDDKDDDE